MQRLLFLLELGVGLTDDHINLLLIAQYFKLFWRDAQEILR